MTSSDQPLEPLNPLRHRHPSSVYPDGNSKDEHVDSGIVDRSNSSSELSTSTSATTTARASVPLFDRTRAFMTNGRPVQDVVASWEMKRDEDRMENAEAVDRPAVEPPLLEEPSVEAKQIKSESRPSRREDHEARSEDEDDDDQVHEYLTGIRSPPPSTPKLEPTPPTAGEIPPPEEEKVCRICFDGEDSELGRLFSPCKCRGTSRHVHVTCLATWRARSARASSFYQCDQCGYRYKFRRTALANILSHRATLLALTFILFTALVYLAGFAANLIIRSAENRRAELAGTFFEDLWISDHVILGEGVKEAVDFFGTKIETTRWAQDAIRNQPKPITNAPTTNMIGGLTRFRPFMIDLILHFTKGLSLVGLISSFHTYIATSFISPLGRGLFRMLRPARAGGNARGRPGQRDPATNLSQLVVVMFVIVGAVKAISHTYHGVKWGAKKALARVENLVLDV